MEHRDLIRYLAESSSIKLEEAQLKSLELFSREIFASNKLFNLTGHDSIEKIVRDLIIDSIIPLYNLNVPRGTTFCDLGTGAGIPGVPLAIIKPDIHAFLVDSSEKKAMFISGICDKIALSNVKVINSRVEDLGHTDELRESFGFAVSRAMGAPYVVLEMGAPLISVGGFIYIYSSISINTIQPAVLSHAEKLGLAGIATERHGDFGIGQDGLLFVKQKHTDKKYPRRYSVISREAEKTR